MTPRQCEIAAEAYTACLLAQCGYDVLVQYGPNQPLYDQVAVKGARRLLISVKGSQDGGWPLAVREKTKSLGYHEAIDNWERRQGAEVIFVLVQFKSVAFGEIPRVYVARPGELAAHMKEQCNGRGDGALEEDYRRDHPHSKYSHQIPSAWKFTRERFEKI